MKILKISLIAAVIVSIAVAAVMFVKSRPPQMMHVTANSPAITVVQRGTDGTDTVSEATGSLDLTLSTDQLSGYRVTVEAGVDGTTSTCRIEVTGGLEPDHIIENSTQGVDATATCTYDD